MGTIKCVRYDPFRLAAIITNGSQDTLELVKGVSGGYKERGKDIVVFDNKASLCLTSALGGEIEWDAESEKILASVARNSIVRMESIQKIKSQYGKQIKFDYVIKGAYSPLEHQKIMYNVMRYTDGCAVLADPGTCKTGPYLWASDSRISSGTIKRVAVITLPQLRRNVLEEMAVQVPHLRGVALEDKLRASHVLRKTYKDQKKNVDYDIYIMSYESMFSYVELFDDDFFQMVVLDEAHRIGAPDSRQTNTILDKFAHMKYKYAVTGSLHANNILSFFNPFKFIGPDTLPMANYYNFRRKYMYPVDPDGRIWKEAPGSVEEVKKIVGKVSVYFKKDDCLDLPDLIREKLVCQLEGEQLDVYKKMKKEFIATVDDMCSKCTMKGSCDNSCTDSIEAKNAVTLVTKLRQITCGFYINTRIEVDANGSERNNSNIIEFDENPKLDLLMSNLSLVPSGDKIIIWCGFIHGIKTIHKRLCQAYNASSIVTCFGDQDAFDQVNKFKQDGVRIFLANQAKAGVGLNIQFSHYQTFFNNSYSYIQRDQAEGRQHRKGQVEKVTVFDLVASKTIDEAILQALNRKSDLSTSLSSLARVV